MKRSYPTPNNVEAQRARLRRYLAIRKLQQDKLRRTRVEIMQRCSNRPLTGRPADFDFADYENEDQAFERPSREDLALDFLWDGPEDSDEPTADGAKRPRTNIKPMPDVTAFLAQVDVLSRRTKTLIAGLAQIIGLFRKYRTKSRLDENNIDFVPFYIDCEDENGNTLPDEKLDPLNAKVWKLLATTDELLGLDLVHWDEAAATDRLLWIAMRWMYRRNPSPNADDPIKDAAARSGDVREDTLLALLCDHIKELGVDERPVLRPAGQPKRPQRLAPGPAPAPSPEPDEWITVIGPGAESFDPSELPD